MTERITTEVEQSPNVLAVRACRRDFEHGNVQNQNAMRHGLRSSRLPKGCERIQRDLNELRRALEDAVFDTHGCVDARAALLISSAVAWERHRRLADRWLRVNYSELSHSDKINYSRESARAATERNKVLESLKLGEQPQGNEFSSLLLAVNAAAPSFASDASDENATVDTADAPERSPSPAGAASVPIADRSAAALAGAGVASASQLATDGNEPNA